MSSTPRAQDPPLLSGKQRRRLVAGVLLGALVYLALALWADLGAIRAALVGFPLALLPAAMGLSFLNYAVRFLRWQRYLGLLGVRLRPGPSFHVYLAGLALTVTPGKLGEAFKSLLLKQLTGTPIHRSAPIVLAERFTDLCGFLVLLALGGIASVPEQQWIFWATLGLCALLLFLAGSRRCALLIVRAVAAVPALARLAPRVEGAFESTRVLLRLRELPLAVLIATAGWSLECLGFWLIASALAPAPLAPHFALFCFSLSAVAGAVLIVFPGGLGVTEATMGGLLARELRRLGLAPAAAQASSTAATILTRLCTLWFAVGVGLVATALFARRARRAGARSSSARQVAG